MPEAISTPNLVALPATSQYLGWGEAFLPPQANLDMSDSPTTLGLNEFTKLLITWEEIRPILTNI